MAGHHFTCAAVCTTIATAEDIVIFCCQITGHAVPFAIEDYVGTCHESSVWQERILPKMTHFRLVKVYFGTTLSVTQNHSQLNQTARWWFQYFLSTFLTIFLPLIIKGNNPI